MLCAEGNEEVLSQKGWLYEKKYDGERTLAYLTEGKVRLVNRRGRDITHEFPELQALRGYKTAVLDGEIVCRNMTRTDCPTTANRINRTKPNEIRLLSQVYPAYFVAFDILEADGKDTTGLPLEERKALLRQVAVESEWLKVAQSYADGATLWAETLEKNGEGVVAKRLGSPYLRQRSGNWIKCKAWKECDLKVVGFTSEARQVSALVLEGQGKVNFSFGGQTAQEWATRLKGMVIGEAKNDLGENYNTIAAGLIAVIKFLDRNEKGHLRFPILREVREVI
jgi:bifunctional non-homologous end joining protein LigD